MDRTFSTLLFVLSLLCLGGAALILLNGFIEYLQGSTWRSPSLLQLGYETYLIKARWFLQYQWSWWIRDVLDEIPVFAALLVFAPLAWWTSNFIGNR